MDSQLDDLFPALRWYMPWVSPEGGARKKACLALLLFDNGNVVISGAKARPDIKRIWLRIKGAVAPYRCSPERMREYQALRAQRRAKIRTQTRGGDTAGEVCEP